MSESVTHGFIHGAFCPACGTGNMLVKRDGVLRCQATGCPDPDTAQKILSDPEIHHIVRFDESGHFNAKHPLRERVDGELLDCRIHDEVQRFLTDYSPLINSTWRVKRRDDVEGEEANEWPYLWERVS